MEPIQAAYDILYLLSTADGYDPSEGDVIHRFMDKNYRGQFDCQHETRLLQTLSGEGCRERFELALHEFKTQSKHEDRIALLKFAVDLIAADEKVSEQERMLLNQLAHAWGVDIQMFLKQYLR